MLAEQKPTVPGAADNSEPGYGHNDGHIDCHNSSARQTRLRLLLTLAVSAFVHLAIVNQLKLPDRLAQPKLTEQPISIIAVNLDVTSTMSTDVSVQEAVTTEHNIAPPSPRDLETVSQPLQTIPLDRSDSEPLAAALPAQNSITADLPPTDLPSSTEPAQTSNAVTAVAQSTNVTEPPSGSQIAQLNLSANVWREQTNNSADTTPLTVAEVSQLHEVLEELMESIATRQPSELTHELLIDQTRYVMHLESALADNPMSLPQISARITRESEGVRYVASVRMQEKTFAHYAKFINNWDPDVTLSRDIVIGAFHSNSPVNLATDTNSRPLFNGPVTLAQQQSISRRVRESGIFLDSLQTGVGRINMPRQLWPEISDPQWQHAEYYYFDDDTRLTFLENGSVSWHTEASNTTGVIPPNNKPVLLMGQGRARFEIDGTVEGSYLLYSPRQVLITGNLRYRSRQQLDTAHDDYLAIISDGSIEVAAAHVTGPGDLQIDAALFARNRFSVRRFRDRQQGELAIYGSLVAGSVSATEPRFTTRVEFDQRFLHTRPPAFPGTGHYELLDWDSHWLLADDSPAD